MKIIFRRYILPWFICSAVFLFFWIAAILSAEGFVASLFGLLFSVTLIGYIPYAIYEDFRLGIRYCKEAREAYDTGKYKEADFYISIGQSLAEMYGLPGFITKLAVNYLKKK
jgi:hypothetical protein